MKGIQWKTQVEETRNAYRILVSNAHRKIAEGTERKKAIIMKL
jgi:hypothetical protein